MHALVRFGVFCLAFYLLTCGSASAETAYHVDVTDAYFDSPDKACQSLTFDPYVAGGETYYVTAQTEVGPISSYVSYSTCALRVYSESGGYKNIQGEVGGVLAKITSKECEPGTTDSLSWPRYQEDDAGNEIPGTRVPIFTNPVCVQGCEANHTSSVDDCFYDGTNFLFCVFTVTQTGPVCETPSSAPDVPAGCPAGYQEVNGKCRLVSEPDPCEANPQAEGCTSGGDTGGGDTGGDTGGGDTGGGDSGGGSTGGGDTGGGDTGGGNTGGDTGGGDTGGSTPGDSGVVTGLSCGEPLSCSGDAIQCAVLNMQKQETCDQQTRSNLPKYQDDIESFLDGKGESAELDEGDGEIDISQLFTGSTSTRFLSAACPPPKSFSLTTAGGRTFEFTYEPLCQLAIDLSYLIVIAASIFYAVYVGRSVGGE